MMMRRIAAALVLMLGLLPQGAFAGYVFDSIDGGKIALDGYAGHPVLVVNTASLCGFSHQFDDLQHLEDTYGPKGLVVLAVSSNDFNQELATEGEVKKYCAANFDLTLPMTAITPVKGPSAHPFYVWLRDAHGFVPGWNFNKVLIGPKGELVATWGAPVNPMSRAIVSKFEPYLK